MKERKDSPDTAELRRRAEDRLKPLPETPLSETPHSDTQHLIHELQVHQIELEMQKEELLQSRATLEAAMAQYTDFYDFAPVGYFILARDGTIRCANLAGARLLGSGARPADGSALRDSSLATATAPLGTLSSIRCLRTGPRRTAKCRSTKRGMNRSGLTLRQPSPRTDRNAALSWLTSPSTGGRRKLCWRSLCVSRHCLSAIPDIIMEVDANKVYTWANGPGIDFFGEDVIGREAAYYFEGEQNTYGAVKPLFNGDENVIYLESWQRNKHGAKRLLAWWCRVLKDEHGNVTGALSSARDITERKQVEQQLTEQLTELRRWHQATLDREMRILELKREVNELLARAGQPPRYARAEED